MEDGLLCRNDQDCMWLDERLRCTDYKMDWSVARDWFNGDAANIVGSCDCLQGFMYEEDQISCIVSNRTEKSPINVMILMFQAYSSLSGVAIFFIVIAVIVGACILCAFWVCLLRTFKCLGE